MYYFLQNFQIKSYYNKILLKFLIKYDSYIRYEKGLTGMSYVILFDRVYFDDFMHNYNDSDYNNKRAAVILTRNISIRHTGPDK